MKAWEKRGSKLHGQGIFAARDIRRGERILEYVGERITHEEADRRGVARERRARRTEEAKTYLFELNSRWCVDGDVPGNEARFMNHSCDPNCEAVQTTRNRIWIVARRRIRAGEELVYDYGFDLDNYRDHPCRCGAEWCVGYIVARRHWGRVLRREQERAA